MEIEAPEKKDEAPEKKDEATEEKDANNNNNLAAASLLCSPTAYLEALTPDNPYNARPRKTFDAIAGNTDFKVLVSLLAFFTMALSTIDYVTDVLVLAGYGLARRWHYFGVSLVVLFYANASSLARTGGSRCKSAVMYVGNAGVLLPWCVDTWRSIWIRDRRVLLEHLALVDDAGTKTKKFDVIMIALTEIGFESVPQLVLQTYVLAFSWYRGNRKPSSVELISILSGCTAIAHNLTALTLLYAPHVYQKILGLVYFLSMFVLRLSTIVATFVEFGAYGFVFLFAAVINSIMVHTQAEVFERQQPNHQGEKKARERLSDDIFIILILATFIPVTSFDDDRTIANFTRPENPIHPVFGQISRTFLIERTLFGAVTWLIVVNLSRPGRPDVPLWHAYLFAALPCLLAWVSWVLLNNKVFHPGAAPRVTPPHPASG